jgi:hypothetical protein
VAGKPVEKAFSRLYQAFLLEKLDENKNCGNHRLSSEYGELLGQADHTTMAGNPNAIQLCCPAPAIVVNRELRSFR